MKTKAYAMLYKSASKFTTAILASLALAGGTWAIENIIDVFRRERFKRNLASLLRDPELSQYPKNQIERYALTFYELNPTLASNPEILKTFLRSSLAMQGVDPSFAARVASQRPSLVNLRLPIGSAIVQTLMSAK